MNFFFGLVDVLPKLKHWDKNLKDFSLINSLHKRRKTMLHFVWSQRQRIVLATLFLVVIASPMVLAEEKIEWAESMEKGLAEAKEAGKPIMMDFYTEW